MLDHTHTFSFNNTKSRTPNGTFLLLSIPKVWLDVGVYTMATEDMRNMKLFEHIGALRIYRHYGTVVGCEHMNRHIYYIVVNGLLCYKDR